MTEPLSLAQIEECAEGLALRLYATSSVSEAKLLGIQLAGLRDYAHIKQVADNRAEHNTLVVMRERELAAMEQVAESNAKIAAQQVLNQMAAALREPKAEDTSANGLDSMPPSPRCNAHRDNHVCRLWNGHDGAHMNAIGEWTE